MIRGFQYLCGVVALALLVACGEESGDTIAKAQERIEKDLQGANIYERGNLPEDPAPQQVLGYYDIIDGKIYRHIVNEGRYGRANSPVIAAGDSLALYFDARVYSGKFENSTTFYTNIEARRAMIAGNNPDFDPLLWPITPLRIKVGEDPKILKSVQVALIGSRAGDGNPENDEQGGVASDEVRVYLTPDVGFGGRSVYDVPGGSTLVFELTDIEIIK